MHLLFVLRLVGASHAVSCILLCLHAIFRTSRPSDTHHCIRMAHLSGRARGFHPKLFRPHYWTTCLPRPPRPRTTSTHDASCPTTRAIDSYHHHHLTSICRTSTKCSFHPVVHLVIAYTHAASFPWVYQVRPPCRPSPPFCPPVCPCESCRPLPSCRPEMLPMWPWGWLCEPRASGSAGHWLHICLFLLVHLC